jgi:hypothetical protein
LLLLLLLLPALLLNRLLPLLLTPVFQLLLPVLASLVAAAGVHVYGDTPRALKAAVSSPLNIALHGVVSPAPTSVMQFGTVALGGWL